LDGKHITIEAPPNSGSLFFNFKKSFSIVLLAICDHEYRLTAVDVGSAGHNSDGGIFKRCNIGQRLYTDDMNLPPPEMLPNFALGGFVPHVIVGDAAFPLRRNLMKPYGDPSDGTKLDDMQKIFNYRLARARGRSENLFGLMVQRWRLLYNGRIKLSPDTLLPVIKAILILHNYVQKRGANTPSGSIGNPFSTEEVPDEKSWLIQNLPRKGDHAGPDPIAVRKIFTEYFSGTGSVHWQNRYAFVPED
jgi:hypothetical protein